MSVLRGTDQIGLLITMIGHNKLVTLLYPVIMELIQLL